MGLQFTQNEATADKRRFTIECLLLDGRSPATGLSFSGSDIKFSKLLTESDFITDGGTVTEIADGFYFVEMVAGHVDTKGQIGARLNKSGVLPDYFEHQVI